MYIEAFDDNEFSEFCVKNTNDKSDEDSDINKESKFVEEKVEDENDEVEKPQKTVINLFNM